MDKQEHEMSVRFVHLYPLKIVTMHDQYTKCQNSKWVKEELNLINYNKILLSTKEWIQSSH